MVSKTKFKTVKNDFPKMRQSVEAVDGKRVNVGVMGENAWLAGIHEYGCRIKVTEKMRAWLRANGLHLKKETTEIVIPERSFLRNGFDECHKAVVDEAERLISLVFEGKAAESELFRTVGILLSSRIKQYALDLSRPPNHPFTVEKNGGKANPLVNTGDMIGSISYEVE